MADVNNGVIKTDGDPISGKNIWYFIQLSSAAIGSKAILPAQQTEGSTTLSGDMLDEQTKFGRVLKKGSNEHSIEISQYFVPKDTAVADIKEAQIKGSEVKVWRVIVDPSVAEDKSTYKEYPAMFGRAIVDELTLDDGDDFVEVSYTLNIKDSLKNGTFPLSDEDVKVLSEQYAYERPGETTGELGDIKTAP